ncbi:hypothetical protein E2C01_029399 [Portunus trituberculatus]|uniref:Uncharacterized protein n=1 Tax=Portunus trituberculatus TaxID=210409 RepID=A0A5B7ERQ8_PORTR|nr:hypothetical protein [Portunus trituberculatus]
MVFCSCARRPRSCSCSSCSCGGKGKVERASRQAGRQVGMSRRDASITGSRGGPGQVQSTWEPVCCTALGGGGLLQVG